MNIQAKKKNLQKPNTSEIFELKDALAYANGIINTIREPLVVLYPELIIKSVNKAFYTTFKTDPKETVGKRIFNLGNGQWDIPLLKKLLEDTLAKKKSFHDFEVEHDFETIGKKIMLLNAHKLPIKSNGDEMTLLAIEDITEKRILEKKVGEEKHAHEEIERLKEISRQKDDFITMASHELKTPVTSIRAFAQLLQEDYALAGNVEAAEMLSRMNTQVIKLTSLIEDLLDLGRMEGGKLQYRMDYFDFNNMINEVVAEMQLTTHAHPIRVKLVKTFNIYGDRNRIAQVLTNLLSNAIKYSVKTHIIKVSSTTDKQFVKVHVKDFGIGVSKEKQDKIFKRFFRVSGVKENTYPGLGLGLYISSAIVKRHKGIISVKSVKGKGATFSIKLPIKNNKPIQKTISKAKRLKA